jgi:2,3-bisphosphoglycerate-dependent phosphoglycerate mutase
MKLFLVRHGESEDDLDDSYGGAADFRLTERGREQAREVGARISESRVDAVYTSPLRRARECAEILSGEIGLTDPPIVVDELKERNSYGVLSGLTKDRARDVFGYVLDALQEKPGYSREPLMGAEDFEEFVSRVRRAFEHVVADARKNNFDRVVIVTHGKFTQALFAEVLGIDKDVYLDLSALNVVDYEPAMASIDSDRLRDRE